MMIASYLDANPFYRSSPPGLFILPSYHPLIVYIDRRLSREVFALVYRLGPTKMLENNHQPHVTDMLHSEDKPVADPTIRQVSNVSSTESNNVAELQSIILDDGHAKYRSLSWWRAGCCKWTRGLTGTNEIGQAQ